MRTETALPRFDRSLLRAAARIVPASERGEWRRTWQAELWHAHHRGRRGDGLDLSAGLVRDALWLRGDSWRRMFSGTPTLCLASLAGLCMVAMLFALAFAGSWRELSPHLAEQFRRFLVAAPLVVFVAFATGSRRYVESSTAGRKLLRIRRQMFFVVKTALALLLCFLLSADVCLPISLRFPNTAELLQIFFFVVLALVGLRWAFADQEQRCEQCLRSLALPARVGRPSHNLLEWNGTEQRCGQGHGLLSVPEMESSWRQRSQWVELEPAGV